MDFLKWLTEYCKDHDVKIIDGYREPGFFIENKNGELEPFDVLEAVFGQQCLD